MKFVRHSLVVAAVYAAVSTSAMADTGSKAIQLTDAQLAKLTAAGSISVDNRGHDVSQSNSGRDGTSFIRSTRGATVCKPASNCGYGGDN